jgi:iron-sulfur cluster repair protein YtfE (RIC family)
MKKEFKLPLPALLYFVKESCHENLHHAIIELRDLTNEREIPQDTEIRFFIKDFIRRLQIHLLAEETDLFPLFEKHKNIHNIYPIHNLIKDHAQFHDDLIQIRRMTNNFEIHENIELKKIDFYRKLIELERIIQNHIHIENYVLYPMMLRNKAL